MVEGGFDPQALEFLEYIPVRRPVFKSLEISGKSDSDIRIALVYDGVTTSFGDRDGRSQTGGAGTGNMDRVQTCYFNRML